MPIVKVDWWIEELLTPASKLDAFDPKVIGEVREICGPPLLRRPKVVTSGGKIVRDVDVDVGPADVNYQASCWGKIGVRRDDYLTVDFEAHEKARKRKG